MITTAAEALVSRGYTNAWNPEAAMGLAANQALEEVAREAKARLRRAIERV